MTDIRTVGFNATVNTPIIQTKKDEATTESTETVTAQPAATMELGSKALDYLEATSNYQGATTSKTTEAESTSGLSGVSQEEIDRISASMAEFESTFSQRMEQVNEALTDIPGSENISDSTKMYLTSECIHQLDMPGTSLNDYEDI